jgi:Putative MetA-pathway of phenol degradation
MRIFGFSSTIAIALTLLVTTPAGYASCGAGYCVINTNWDTQGVPTAPGKFRVDMHYEFIDQDQLREGTKNISAAQDADEEALEQNTRNQNLASTLDYVYDNHWAVAVTVPWVKREHNHIADPADTAEPERWDFSGLADTRIIGRYQFDRATAAPIWGLQGGMRLATGKIDIDNSEGVVAERSLQPSSGSNDAIVGAYYAYRQPMRSLSYFAQLQYERSMSSKDDYRPGNQTSLNVGLTYPATEKFSVMLQINAQQKQRDSGENAEADLSGGRYAYLSPGISYALSRDVKVYTFWQKPLYRNVNGIQLSANEALIAGLSVSLGH